MANVIKQKRGTSDPGASDLVVGELAINTTDGGVFTKTDGGSVVEVGAGGVSEIDDLSDAKTQSTNNIGIGTYSIDSLTSGTNNVAFGTANLYKTTTGSYNVAVGGTGALYQNISGSYNIGIGTNALYSNTSSYNVAVGHASLLGNTTGTYNTGLGYQALTNVTSGAYNVGIGRNSGFNLTTGNFNICIGNSATASSATVSHEITLGDSNISSLRIPGLDYTIDSYGKVNAKSYSTPANAVSALDIDLRTGNYFTKTISANSTFTFSNPPASGTVGSFTLELTHTSGTVAWPSSVKWPADTAPTLTTGKTHLFVFVTDDGGSRYRGAALADYVN